VVRQWSGGFAQCLCESWNSDEPLAAEGLIEIGNVGSRSECLIQNVDEEDLVLAES
jgi:hypothetical protein